MEAFGVAEAKRRFKELIDRVGSGERFVVSKHGKPVVALVLPNDAALVEAVPYTGFGPIAGFLSEWTSEDIDEMVEHMYEARRRAKDRAAPSFDG